MDGNIPTSNKDPLDYVRENAFSLVLSPVTIVECVSVIKNLNNTKTDLDTFPVVFLKTFADILAPIISEMVNNSFLTGNFPSCLKTACIIPIYKKSDKKVVKNYRPISMLPTLSKIFEKLIHRRLYDFVISHSLVSPNQFGFQKGKSTVDAVSCVTEYLYDSLNNKKHAIMILVDLSKAFDTVNNKILLKKLEMYGIRGITLTLIESYLSDRVGFVRISDSSSERVVSNIGIPQGGTLSPLLFLMYLNDMPNFSTNSTSVLFADDTTLLLSDLSYNKLIETAKAELIRLKEWMDSNRLTINKDKTCVMLISNRLNVKVVRPELDIDNIPLTVVDYAPFLGVIFDNGLNFSRHCEHISSKISKSIGVLYRLKQFIPQDLLLNLYYSLVYPYFIYCNIVWGNTFSCHKRNLVTLQKRAVRLINSVPLDSHTNDLFYRSKLLKLEDVNRFFLGVYMFNNTNKYSQISSLHNYE